MKLHIFDSTGDTVMDVTESTVDEAERIVTEAWGRGSQVFTKEGERVKDMDALRRASREAEEAYVVPQLRGG